MNGVGDWNRTLTLQLGVGTAIVGAGSPAPQPPFPALVAVKATPLVTPEVTKLICVRAPGP